MDTPPFALHGLDHIVLRVVDLDRMRSFYKEVLGCTDEREQPEIGLYQLRAGHALIDLITIEGKLGAMGGAAPGTGGRTLDHFALAPRSEERSVGKAWGSTCRSGGSPY